jgi:hypothetical protein
VAIFFLNGELQPCPTFKEEGKGWGEGGSNIYQIPPLFFWHVKKYIYLNYFP